MPVSGPTEASSNRNLKRLFVLRNLIIAGGTLALATIHFLTEMNLPLAGLTTVIAALGLLNLWTWQRIRSGDYIRDREFVLQLTLDVLALATFLYLTGGATNPFAWFFLIPLIISATVLSAAVTWSLAALTTACYTLLLFWYQPLGGEEHMHHGTNFAQHVFGMWFGFVLSAALIAWFVVGMANTLALEGQRKNILVNTIAPVAASRLTEGLLPPAVFDALKERIPPLCEVSRQTTKLAVGLLRTREGGRS